MIVAQRERHGICDAFERFGPEAPTLCGEWTTLDLATHLIVREGRPDRALGILARPFAGRTEAAMAELATRPWEELIERIRNGPPSWSPARVAAIDQAINTAEYFVHHEDVLRAQPDWEPRSLDEESSEALAVPLKRMSKMLARRAPAGLVLVASDGPRVVANSARPEITVHGPVSELLLFVYGRQDHTRVDIDGPPELVAATRDANFGL